jgi:hypothetical protein
VGDAGVGLLLAGGHVRANGAIARRWDDRVAAGVRMGPQVTGARRAATRVEGVGTPAAGSGDAAETCGWAATHAPVRQVIGGLGALVRSNGETRCDCCTGTGYGHATAS